MASRSNKLPPLKYPVTPLQQSDEHHCQCPICGHWVDELDLEEVLRHVDRTTRRRGGIDGWPLQFCLPWLPRSWAS